MSRKHQAFTLIELLVVISIIALLIGILLPALGAARSASRNLACLSNVRQMGIAVSVYATENDQYYLPTFYANTSDWFRIVSALIEGKPLESPNPADPGYVSNADIVFSDALRCPDAKVQNDEHDANYGSNMMVLPIVSLTGPLYNLTWLRSENLRNASEMMVLADSSQNALSTTVSGVPPGHTFAGLDLIDNRKVKTDQDYLRNSGADPDELINPGLNKDFTNGLTWRDFRWRHQADEGVNFVWGDGHGSSQAIGTVIKEEHLPRGALTPFDPIPQALPPWTPRRPSGPLP